MAGEVLRKKVHAAHKGVGIGGLGADRAWRLAFARAARDMMRLPLDFVALTASQMSLTEVLELPPDRGLILMLHGPEDGLGLLILSPGLYSAMIEMLTMGRCGTTVPEPRKPTRTDAAMLSPLADLAMEGLEEGLAEEPDLLWASGFRFASFIEEARPLGLLLEDLPYRVLSAQVALTQGGREGDLLLVLPAEGRGRSPRVKADAHLEALRKPAFASALAARVEGADCRLDAVVARLSMPLADTMRLAVDMVLALPHAALDQISFEGLDGRRVAEGRLGQHRGMRAVRLTSGAQTGSSVGSGGAGFSDASGLAARNAWQLGSGQDGAAMPAPPFASTNFAPEALPEADFPDTGDFAFDPLPATGTD